MYRKKCIKTIQFHQQRIIQTQIALQTRRRRGSGPFSPHWERTDAHHAARNEFRCDAMDQKTPNPGPVQSPNCLQDEFQIEVVLFIKVF